MEKRRARDPMSPLVPVRLPRRRRWPQVGLLLLTVLVVVVWLLVLGR